MRASTIIAVVAIILASSATSPAQSNAQGAVELSNGIEVPQNQSLPKYKRAAREHSQGRAD